MDQYVKYDSLGVGSFGNVYKVLNPNDGKYYAMKTLQILPGMEEWELHNKYF